MSKVGHKLIGEVKMVEKNVKTSKKCFIYCDEKHRAFKVPGEKHTYWCPECEIKITSDAKCHYVSWYDKKTKGPGRKPGPKPKGKGSIKLKDTIAANFISDFKPFICKCCNTCFHSPVCFFVKVNPKLDLSETCCTVYHGRPT